MHEEYHPKGGTFEIRDRHRPYVDAARREWSDLHI